MQDLSHILKRAKSFADNKDLSAKRDAFGCFVIYSALTGNTEVTSAFLESLFEKEASTGKKDLKYLLFCEFFHSKTIEAHTASLNFFFGKILDAKSLSVLKHILTDPMRTLDVAAPTQTLADYIKNEFKCPPETAFALVLFLQEWHKEIKHTRQQLLKPGKSF